VSLIKHEKMRANHHVANRTWRHRHTHVYIYTIMEYVSNRNQERTGATKTTLITHGNGFDELNEEGPKVLCDDYMGKSKRPTGREPKLSMPCTYPRQNFLLPAVLEASDLHICEVVRQLNPKVQLTLGGVHVTALRRRKTLRKGRARLVDWGELW